MKKITIST